MAEKAHTHYVIDLSMSHKTEDKLPPHSRFVPRQKPRRHGSKWLLGSAPSSWQKHGKADESDMPSCLRDLPFGFSAMMPLSLNCELK